jgi:hypothetical protein
MKVMEQKQRLKERKDEAKREREEARKKKQAMKLLPGKHIKDLFEQHICRVFVT